MAQCHTANSVRNPGLLTFTDIHSSDLQNIPHGLWAEARTPGCPGLAAEGTQLHRKLKEVSRVQWGGAMVGNHLASFKITDAQILRPEILISWIQAKAWAWSFFNDLKKIHIFPPFM